MQDSYTSNNRWPLVIKQACKRGISEDQDSSLHDLSFPFRYFSGVQGDTSRQGELFGIKNIFKLHEDTLATKMAVRLFRYGQRH